MLRYFLHRSPSHRVLFNSSRCLQTQNNSPPPTPPKELPGVVDVVIVGGGVVGCSAAYHLAKLGKSVLLLEQNKLTSGTTWHAAGLIGVSRATSTETMLSLYGSKLYAELEEETGHSTGFKQCGSLTVARTPERMHALRRIQARMTGFGVHAEVVSPHRCGELWSSNTDSTPLIKTDDILGGLWLPQDGSASPTDVCMSLAKGAKKLGAVLAEGVHVSGFITRSDRTGGRRRIIGVETSSGSQIHADAVLLCAGQWTRHLAAQIGVNVPMHSTEHFYAITNPISGVHSSLPVFRDPDAMVYVREWGNSLCVGCFEKNAKPVFTERVPSDFAFSLFSDDWDHFAPYFSLAAERIPALNTASIQSMVNGPESFTPDMHYILGETFEVDKLFVCAGMNSSGIASAGGAGKAISEWIVNGEPTMDLWAVDVRRFAPQITKSPHFLRSRIPEALGLHYSVPWPRRQMESMRNLRVSPLFSRLNERGAVWGEKAGWERALFFAPGASEEQRKQLNEPCFERPKWHENVLRECEAARKGVALFDQTSFSKYVVQGRDAVDVLSRLCSNKVDVDVGVVVYTTMLNKHGGIEGDLTVTRVSRDEFYLVSSTGLVRKDLHRLRGAIKSDQHCVINDATGMFAVLSVMGPKSRELLASLSYADFSAEAFPFHTSKDVDIGPVMVTAKRVSYVGELGWELHIPVESAHVAFDMIESAAVARSRENPSFIFANAGYHAIDALRIEKGMRAWGHELSPDYSLVEAGLLFAADLKKDFIGRDSVTQQREKGVSRKLVNFLLEPEDESTQQSQISVWGDELIVLLDSATGIRVGGKTNREAVVGRVTSAGYGYGVGGFVCMGYVTHSDVGVKGFVENSVFGVEVGERTVRVKCASLKPLYDPKGEKMREMTRKLPVTESSSA